MGRSLRQSPFPGLVSAWAGERNACRFYLDSTEDPRENWFCTLAGNRQRLKIQKKMSGEFRRKGVLVTGGGAAVCRATAVLLGREKANVGVVDCHAERAAESAVLVEQAGGRAIA